MKQTVFDFELLPDGVIIIILNSVFNIEGTTQQYQYNLANIGSVRMINLIMKASPIKVHIFDFMETPLWLRSIATMGIFEGDDAFMIDWDSIIKEYHGRMIREHRYTSRVHDLLDITSSPIEPVWIKRFARFLLLNLITTEMSVLDRQFLNGQMIDIPVLTDDTIKATIEKTIDSNEMFTMKYWDVRNVTNMSELFKPFYEEKRELSLTYWDTSNVIDMSNMFQSITDNIYGITNWNTCRVKSMSRMFEEAESFNQPLFWNTSNVTNMNRMFRSAYMFNQQLEWNTSNVTDMGRMFSFAFAFNQPLLWNTSNVTNMERMFEDAVSFNQPLPWNTKKVIDMSYMFIRCVKFNQPLPWNTKNVKNMVGMFMSARKFNQPLLWDTSNVTDMSDMFEDAESFNQPLK
jgi:hypothetical protein